MKNQYLSNFETFIAASGYQNNTQKMLRNCVRDFLVWWAKCPLLLTLKDTVAWHEYLQERPSRRGGGLSARMIRHYLYALRLFYNYLEECNVLKNNPMSAFILPSVQSSKRQILSFAEVERLYACCAQPEDRMMLHLYYGLGLRRSEGAALRFGEVDTEKGLVYVRESKGGKLRVVPMSACIREDFEVYKQGKTAIKEALFLNLSGEGAARRLKKLLKKADLSLEYSLHSLRHSIASHLLLSGLKMEEVRRFLGHQHLEATQIYLHHGLEDLA